MIGNFSEFLKNNGCVYREFTPIANLSSIGIDTVVRMLVYPENVEQFVAIIDYLSEHNIKYKVLGNLSNVLFREKFFSGVVVKTTKIMRKSVAGNRVMADCGVIFASVIQNIAKLNLGGFEGLSGIPGSLGGMLQQNAGAYGYEISDRFISAEIYDSNLKSVYRYAKDDMRFSYRSSVLKDRNLFVLSAEFEAIPTDKNDVLGQIKELSEKRKSAQPISQHSLGSVFKRINGVSAGYYIDQAGLKGLRVGGAEVSQKHAGFVVNIGDAVADDILELIRIIKQRVFDKFGIMLEEEIEII